MANKNAALSIPGWFDLFFKSKMTHLAWDQLHLHASASEHSISPTRLYCQGNVAAVINRTKLLGSVCQYCVLLKLQ